MSIAKMRTESAGKSRCGVPPLSRLFPLEKRCGDAEEEKEEAAAAAARGERAVAG